MCSRFHFIIRLLTFIRIVCRFYGAVGMPRCVKRKRFYRVCLSCRKYKMLINYHAHPSMSLPFHNILYFFFCSLLFFLLCLFLSLSFFFCLFHSIIIVWKWLSDTHQFEIKLFDKHWKCSSVFCGWPKLFINYNFSCCFYISYTSTYNNNKFTYIIDGETIESLIAFNCNIVANCVAMKLSESSVRTLFLISFFI